MSTHFNTCQHLCQNMSRYVNTCQHICQNVSTYGCHLFHINNGATPAGCLDTTGMPHLAWSMTQNVGNNAKVLGQYGSHWRRKVNQIEPNCCSLRNLKMYLVCADTCTGNETSIERCHEPGLWEHMNECNHGEDVVLSCTVRSINLKIIDFKNCCLLW